EKPRVAVEELLKAWVPPTRDDLKPGRPEDVERNEEALPRFLRPAKDSPLATGGAGRTDPSLPSYVGAVPPEGVPAWDWGRTWLAPPPGTLITLSKDGKADCDTLSKALEKVEKPNTTIRVLDRGTYRESLLIANRKKHAGLTLEAPLGATIIPP